MWDHLPVAELHLSEPPPPERTVHINVLHLQCAAAIGQIDRKLKKLHETDPTHYYIGDYDELLDRRAALVERSQQLLA
jgi:hypothetical protein